MSFQGGGWLENQLVIKENIGNKGENIGNKGENEIYLKTKEEIPYKYSWPKYLQIQELF